MGDVEHKKLGRDLFLVMAILAVIGWLADKCGRFPWFSSYSYRNVLLLIVFLPVVVAAAVAIITTRRIGTEWKPATLCGVFILLGLA
ncbi:MAG: hypothetical protein WBN75_19280 [Verrucomicrobiia bacterium]